MARIIVAEWGIKLVLVVSCGFFFIQSYHILNVGYIFLEKAFPFVVGQRSGMVSYPNDI